MNLEAVKRRAFVCCPFDWLVERYLPLLAAEGIQPEIGLDAGLLHRYRWPTFRRVARRLRAAGLGCTVHAPFTDLPLGAADPEIRRVAARRLSQALRVAGELGARSMVVHTGFDPRHHGGDLHRWREAALEVLGVLAGAAAASGVPLMLENVFEHDPALHRFLLDALPAPGVGFCLDLGHQVVFSRTPAREWLEALGDRLGQLHLHDNRGRNDDHLAVGEGILDFDGLFAWLAAHGRRPILTLEPHAESAVRPALEGLGRLLDRFPSVAPA
ncbi:sugar phosphate isomerase/epimerase [Dissulfurirhabdus thermomarina]|uniref:Sugar phosphate isomerase/epimerase n=1 Tax=Dissulfurirhabdus thermomarina TaxID=1765737 RepID=A0A6N9TNY6_DISTH|nr:sugar phosphate isomerase/epimerase [Dissulfurirhabdus thermomarina]NDY41464.1 sugar phosphate isomerase/epimerase [Dissulfurirhabdus thermomarina]NMX24254.1 sugar phosphate isomerase/epimerase [Dissulfurirhabdus thermomarina]